MITLCVNDVPDCNGIVSKRIKIYEPNRFREKSTQTEFFKQYADKSTQVYRKMVTFGDVAVRTYTVNDYIDSNSHTLTKSFEKIQDFLLLLEQATRLNYLMESVSALLTDGLHFVAFAEVSWKQKIKIEDFEISEALMDSCSRKDPEKLRFCMNLASFVKVGHDILQQLDDFENFLDLKIFFTSLGCPILIESKQDLDALSIKQLAKIFFHVMEELQSRIHLEFVNHKTQIHQSEFLTMALQLLSLAPNTPNIDRELHDEIVDYAKISTKIMDAIFIEECRDFETVLKVYKSTVQISKAIRDLLAPKSPNYPFVTSYITDSEYKQLVFRSKYLSNLMSQLQQRLAESLKHVDKFLNNFTKRIPGSNKVLRELKHFYKLNNEWRKKYKMYGEFEFQKGLIEYEIKSEISNVKAEALYVKIQSSAQNLMKKISTIDNLEPKCFSLRQKFIRMKKLLKKLF